jgi:hypothetical protein
MNTRRTLLATSLLALGCSSPAPPPVSGPAASGARAAVEAAAATPVAGASPAPRVIGRVRIRDVTLTMHATGRGPRFALSDGEGATLARDLDERALAARYPDVAAVYRSALAGAPFLDARLDTQDEPNPAR